MPTLRELMEFMCEYAQQSGQSFSDDLAREMEQQIAEYFPRAKIYVPAPTASRSAAIAPVVKTLPTDVIAKRMGVSRSWARRISKRREGGE